MKTTTKGFGKKAEQKPSRSAKQAEVSNTVKLLAELVSAQARLERLGYKEGIYSSASDSDNKSRLSLTKTIR